MYGWYDSNRVWDRKCKALYEDDVHGISQLYGMKPMFRFGRVCEDGSYPGKPTRVPNYRPPTARTERVQTITFKPDPPRIRPTERPYYPTPQRPTIPPRRPEPDPRQPNYPDENPPRRPYYPEQDRTTQEVPRVNEKPEKCNTELCR